ncbi:hypothetical protein B0H19DRAFT_1070104 [Mycena capillaripes]|nr:hypothetical protein B0H19DRAFT_1070104 [Mycena capillaripes]
MNSKQLPYLPGVWKYHRSDMKHWAFMCRVREVTPEDLYYVFYQPLILVWTRSLNPREGTFQDEYIHCLHTVYARVAADCQKFTTSSLWGNQAVALQCGLWELEAWLRFMELRLSFGNLTLEELRCLRWATTQEQYIGMWLNGASKEVALHLLVLGVPCFVVNAYTPGEVQWTDGFQQMRPNFFDRSDLVEVIRATNPYYQVAMENAKGNTFYRLGYGGGEDKFP